MHDRPVIDLNRATKFKMLKVCFSHHPSRSIYLLKVTCLAEFSFPCLILMLPGHVETFHKLYLFVIVVQ